MVSIGINEGMLGFPIPMLCIMVFGGMVHWCILGDKGSDFGYKTLECLFLYLYFPWYKEFGNTMDVGRCFAQPH
ncbi:unnamed protein product [Prunus brigantina]